MLVVLLTMFSWMTILLFTSPFSSKHLTELTTTHIINNLEHIENILTSADFSGETVVHDHIHWLSKTFDGSNSKNYYALPS